MILGQIPIDRARYMSVRNTATGRTERAVVALDAFMGSIQPLTDQQRQVLPEGVRQRVELRLYTTTPVFTADQQTGMLADRITYRGDVYDVVRVAQWYALLAHYEADLVRVAEGDL